MKRQSDDQLGGGQSAKTQARLDREAAALRANLARRKVQKRGQAAASRQSALKNSNQTDKPA